MAAVRPKNPVAFGFVLEQLEKVSPIVRLMFGCHALYVGEKIVLILRKKENHVEDNGIWLATSREHHADLIKIFPSMRAIQMFGEKESAWQNLPEDADDFEESAMKVCELIVRQDERVGKIPKPKKRKSVKKTTIAKR